MAAIVDLNTKADAITVSANALAVLIAELKARPVVATQAELDALDAKLTTAQTALDQANAG